MSDDNRKYYCVYADNIDTGERLYLGSTLAEDDSEAVRIVCGQLPVRERDWPWNKGHSNGDEVAVFAAEDNE